MPLCADACPVGALRWTESVVQLDKSTCISCMRCVEACPFGAMYAHGDLDHPVKCDLCGGQPKCVEKCPKGALRYIPEQSLGESKRMNNILSYTHMKEIEFTEKGEQRTIRYAEIGKEEL
jgi:Fe-S-cluster-containing hydrogenase component 2